MNKNNIKDYSEQPVEEGYYFCLTKYYDGQTFKEVLKYEQSCGWMTIFMGYYFEDHGGVDLYWLDEEIDWNVNGEKRVISGVTNSHCGEYDCLKSTDLPFSKDSFEKIINEESN